LQAYAIRKDELPRVIVFHDIIESMAQEQCKVYHVALVEAANGTAKLPGPPASRVG